MTKNMLQQEMYFPCPMYHMMRDDYLPTVKKVSNEYLKKAKKARGINDVYPVIQTDSFFMDERLLDFSKFISQVAWDVLNDQGYAMGSFTTVLTEMWTQQHHKRSAMEHHVHGYGSQLVGFYFLECPKECPKLILHDPRAGKIQSCLPERDPSQLTLGSNMINITPTPGVLMFTNPWLAHSFSRNESDTPFTFVHFNFSVIQNPNAGHVCQVNKPIVV